MVLAACSRIDSAPFPVKRSMFSSVEVMRCWRREILSLKMLCSRRKSRLSPDTSFSMRLPYVCTLRSDRAADNAS